MLQRPNPRDLGEGCHEIHDHVHHQAGKQGARRGDRRFQATDGQPPKDVKLIGRWTAVDSSGGFVLLEGDDPKALTEFALMWSDPMELKVAPVIEDADLGEVLARRRK
jgi:uncharacterized protein DUF3303